MRHTPLSFPDPEPGASQSTGRVRASGDGGIQIDLSDPAAIELLRGGLLTSSGAVVNIEGAMKVAAAWRCLHIITGPCGNLPIDIYRRVSERERQPAVDNPVRAILTSRPNGWQTPAEFRKMLTAHAVMKGDGYGLKIMARGRLLEIWPMDPDRVRCVQNADMSLTYSYNRRDGSQIPLTQADLLHLRGLSWNGVNGVGVLRYAREAMGLSLQVESAGSRLFRQGVIGGQVFGKPGTLGQEAFDRLKQQIEEHRAGAENAHKTLILEDDLKPVGELMSAQDLQFLQLREFQRSDVAMFFGVPPHMAGIVDKTTSWGSGIEQQSTGFVQYTLDDWFCMWEQSIERDLLGNATDVYCKITRAALLRGDTTARWNSYTRGLQWGVYSPDDVRAFEDMNPRPDGDGGIYYDPPNTAGGDPGQETETDALPPPAQ